MNLKDLTIGKKIAGGFGIIIVLLIILGILTFSGVGGIVKNAGEVIDGNKLDGSLAQKEVDHLNWVNKVNALLTDESITTLEVQTDHHKCAFGQWLYGDGRKSAEALVPSLVPALKEIEDPHHALHRSAIEIQKVFKQPHSGLALTLSGRLTDHVNWVSQLGKSLAMEAGGLYSYQAQLRNLVDEAVSMIQGVDKNNASESMSARKQKAYEMIKGLRYGENGNDYFFILDKDTRMVMHPVQPSLEGKDLSGTADITGKKFFGQIVREGLDHGEGFVTYKWAISGTDKQAPKISYGKLYRPFGWIIATGAFLDHTNKALVKRAHEFAEGQPFSTGLQLDPTKCGFGKFLADPATRELAERFPELKHALDGIVEPHNKLHESAVLIEDKVNRMKMNEAMHIFSEDTEAALADVKTHFNAAIAAENALQQGMDKANAVYATQTVPSLNKVQTLLKEIRGTARENIMTDEIMLNAASGTKRNISITAAVAIIAALVLAFFIARGIITVLTRITNGLADGASQVASAAGQVSSSSQIMAEGSSQQAASIEETSSSMEEMSSMTQKNAENAGHAEGLMQETNAVVTKANASMGELTQSMADISKASEETSKIIKTIDEIAFQTNLLALNAAVEAARAGEAGAGFAVVADEVRNLAMRAADAAKDTAQLIEGTVKKVNEGSEIVSTTNEAFSHVEESASKVGQLISEISEASKEQSEGIRQVNNAISEMDNVVQQNASTAEESASASEELNAQAEQLRDYVADLMKMVTGKRDIKTGARSSGKARPAALVNAAAKGEKKKVLPEKTREVRPDQVIPFDDEDDFEDF